MFERKFFDEEKIFRHVEIWVAVDPATTPLQLMADLERIHWPSTGILCSHLPRYTLHCTAV